MEKGNVFSSSIEGIKHLKSEQGELQTKPFLDVCKQLLPILDKFGAAMTVVKSDIGGNISIELMISFMRSYMICKLERLESKYSSNPSRFNYLFSLVLSEVETNSAKSSSSCTNGLLWLTRAMDFLVMLFVNLGKHQDWSMHQACTDSYSKTLKKWHGWLASSSFTVAMKLVPDRKKFMEVIGGEANIQPDMQKFCMDFLPTLAEIHKFLAKCGLDSMKAS